MVLSLVCGSITIDAASIGEYNYIVYFPAEDVYYVSDQPWYIVQYQNRGNQGTKNMVLSDYRHSWYFNYSSFYMGYRRYAVVTQLTHPVMATLSDNCYVIYNASSDGINYAGSTINGYYGDGDTSETYPTIYVAKRWSMTDENTSNITPEFQTNHDIKLYWLRDQTVSSDVIKSAGTITLPEGIDIEKIINETINSTTEVSTRAYTTITNITNIYNSYNAGNITYEEAKEQVDTQMDAISDAANTPTATLKDAVNVTNALTYGQTVNDTLLQDQEEAFWETRDIGNETSANAQQSDQEEIDYLDSLIAETTEKISDLSPSENFTPEQISTTTEIIEGIWENPIIKKLIPVAACFMVICVALGIRYRL